MRRRLTNFAHSRVPCDPNGPRAGLYRYRFQGRRGLWFRRVTRWLS